ncbi:iron dependent repressor, metal binding and dimerization domain protein [Ruminiclostridium cellulolyticum]|uniref:iron dependent repressor, metal binding and dimerization domain protein n=1 Tax=Ruminiclostridium cellulolyticum TaxID=1521 RepID=UPI00031AE2BE|nr:iron dependent repressor, metal binding and dimerization domain protein [Ruminiclostridium cellulolyticum]
MQWLFLKNAQYITIDDNTGYNTAKAMYERHEILTRYLVSIGVSPEIAAKDA